MEVFIQAFIMCTPNGLDNKAGHQLVIAAIRCAARPSTAEDAFGIEAVSSVATLLLSVKIYSNFDFGRGGAKHRGDNDPPSAFLKKAASNVDSSTNCLVTLRLPPDRLPLAPTVQCAFWEILFAHLPFPGNELAS